MPARSCWLIELHKPHSRRFFYGEVMTEWQWSSLKELDIDSLYALLARRQQVFILEQRCLYPDIDALDQRAYHLLGWQVRDGVRTLVV